MTPALTNPLTPQTFHSPPGHPGEKHKPPLCQGLAQWELQVAHRKSSSWDSFTLHEETCWEQVEPVAIPGLQEEFWDVSGWLTAPWACSSPQCPSLPLAGFCSCNYIQVAQQMLFVASSVFLWHRQHQGCGWGGDSPFCGALVRCKCCTDTTCDSVGVPE